MNTSKTLVAGLAAGATYFFLGWLVYGILLFSYMEANMSQEIAKPMSEMIMEAMALGNLMLGMAFAFILTWAGAKGFMAGFMKILVVAFFFNLSVNLSFYSMTTMYDHGITPMIVDTLVNAVIMGISGGSAGWVLGRGSNNAS